MNFLNCLKYLAKTPDLDQVQKDLIAAYIIYFLLDSGSAFSQNYFCLFISSP